MRVVAGAPRGFAPAVAAIPDPDDGVPGKPPDFIPMLPVSPWGLVTQESHRIRIRFLTLIRKKECSGEII